MESIRQNIDDIDNKICELFVERFKYTDEIGKYKASNNISVLKKTRETEILTRLKENYNLSPEFIDCIYNDIFSFSKKSQEKFNTS